MRLRYLIPVVILTIAVLIPIPQTSQAQDDDNQICLQFIRQVLLDLGTNCAEMDRNSACYGFDDIEAMFVEDVDDDFFTAPGDRADLTPMAVLEASAFDLDEEVWGIGVMRIEANIHNAHPTKGVFVALGEVDVENDVDPMEALLPVEPVSVTTSAQAFLFKDPDEASDVRGVVPAGTVLQADAVSPDGGWLRVLYEGVEKNYASWVSVDLLEPGADVTGLPTVDADTRTPMQSSFLRNGYDVPGCPTVPRPLLLVQGPRDAEMDFVVNGAEIRVSDDTDVVAGANVVLRVLPPVSPDVPPTTMRLITITGMAILYPDTEDALLVPPGFYADVCLDPPEDIGLDARENDQLISCPWSGPTPLTAADLAELALLEDLPTDALNYQVDVPVIVVASGSGVQPIQFIFDFADSTALVEEACNAGLLPAEICSYYRF